MERRERLRSRKLSEGQPMIVPDRPEVVGWRSAHRTPIAKRPAFQAGRFSFVRMSTMSNRHQPARPQLPGG